MPTYWTSLENPKVLIKTPKALIFHEVQYSDILRAIYIKINKGGDYDQKSSITQNPETISSKWLSTGPCEILIFWDFFEEIYKKNSKILEEICNFTKPQKVYKTPKFSSKFF